MKKSGTYKHCNYLQYLNKTILIMRLTVIITFVFTIHATAFVFSQGTEISMRLNNTTLEEVIDKIRAETDYRFLYNHEEIKDVKNLDVHFENASTDQVLKEVLKNFDFEYRIVNDVIVIVPSPGKTNKKHELENPGKQKKIIKGKVTDESGTGLPGVSVVVMGTAVGTATNIDGSYELELPLESDKLIFSFIGMETQQVEINGREVVNVVLKVDRSLVEEVIVTGYQTISKERATGSYTIVKADEIKNLETSLQSKLEGVSTGVLNSSIGDANYMSSYLPDSDNDNRLLMRGISTMSENKSPLVVIDGFPTREGLSSVNPNDIDQITFLKDAASASIWGAQSSNGVIVITTKKGEKSAKPKVSYRFSHQFIPKWDLDYLNLTSTEETVDLITEVSKDWTSWMHSTSSGNPLAVLIADYKNGVIDEATYNAGLAEFKSRDNYGQVKDYLLEVGAIQQHDLSIQGGTDKMAYRSAINYVKKSGGYAGNENEKLNLSMNNNFNISDRFKASLGFNVIYQDVNYSALFAAEPGNYGRSPLLDRLSPWELYKDENGNNITQNISYLNGIMDISTWRSSAKQGILDNYGINLFPNLLDDMENTRRGYKSFMARLRGNIDYKVTEELTFSGGFQYERGSRRNKTYVGADTYAVNSSVASFTVIDPVSRKIVEQKIPTGAQQQVKNSDNYAYTIRGALNYNKNINDHSITLLAGGEISKNYFEAYKTTQWGFNENALIEKPVNIMELSGFIPNTLGYYGYTYSFAQPNQFFQVTAADNRFVSYFGNFAYSYKDKYVVNASGRIDNFNRFGGDARFNRKPLWGAGVSWNITKEDFMKGVSLLDYLKLSYTYGKNGNVNRGAIPELTIRLDYNTVLEENGAIILNPKNDQLKWEETITNNIKLDFALFDNKFFGAMELYHRKSKDILASKAVDISHGLSNITTNNGTIVNKGVEIELNAAIMQRSDFYWGTRFLFSYNHNNVVDISSNRRMEYPEDMLTGTFTAPGYSTPGIYSFQWAGLDEQGNPMVLDQNGNTTSNYFDLTGVSMFEFSGTLLPKYVASFTTQFKYKSFELSALFVGNFGHVMRKDVPSILINESRRANKEILNRWKQAGDEDITDIPRAGHGSTLLPASWNMWQYANINVVSADFIKLREVNLIYNVPKSFLSKLSLESTQLMFQVNNPFTWTANDGGIDPEAHDLASGFRSMPIMTSYIFGLNVNF